MCLNICTWFLSSRSNLYSLPPGSVSRGEGQRCKACHRVAPRALKPAFTIKSPLPSHWNWHWNWHSYWTYISNRYINSWSSSQSRDDPRQIVQSTDLSLASEQSFSAILPQWRWSDLYRSAQSRGNLSLPIRVLRLCDAHRIHVRVQILGRTL